MSETERVKIAFIDLKNKTIRLEHLDGQNLEYDISHLNLESLKTGDLKNVTIEKGRIISIEPPVNKNPVNDLTDTKDGWGKIIKIVRDMPFLEYCNRFKKNGEVIEGRFQVNYFSDKALATLQENWVKIGAEISVEYCNYKGSLAVTEIKPYEKKNYPPKGYGKSPEEIRSEEMRFSLSEAREIYFKAIELGIEKKPTTYEDLITRISAGAHQIVQKIQNENGGGHNGGAS